MANYCMRCVDPDFCAVKIVIQIVTAILNCTIPSCTCWKVDSSCFMKLIQSCVFRVAICRCCMKLTRLNWNTSEASHCHGTVIKLDVHRLLPVTVCHWRCESSQDVFHICYVCISFAAYSCSNSYDYLSLSRVSSFSTFIVFHYKMISELCLTVKVLELGLYLHSAYD